jgi:hypothetical protein
MRDMFENSRQRIPPTGERGFPLELDIRGNVYRMIGRLVVTCNQEVQRNNKLCGILVLSSTITL